MLFRSGGNITSDAIKTAVRRALALAESGETAAALAEPVTVQATVDGRNGPITVEVTTDGVNITDVKVLGHSETQGVGSVAADWMPGRIVEANSADVDGVTGATITSDAIKTAVTTAIELARNGGKAALAEPVAVTVTVDGRNGPITVEVTTDGVNILDVKVLEHSETQGDRKSVV